MGFGGAIYNNAGFVELVNCTLTNNAATGGNSLDYVAGAPARGGAVFDSGGTLVLSHCTLAANLAEGARATSVDSILLSVTEATRTAGLFSAATAS